MMAAGDELQDVILVEGEEYAEYVVVDLPAGIPDDALAPGQRLVLEGLDSDQPTLKLPDGKTLTGTYEDNLGSIVVFGQAGAGAGQQAVAYQCHTEKVLSFSAPPATRG